jgi:hypothetical protein
VLHIDWYGLVLPKLNYLAGAGAKRMSLELLAALIDNLKSLKRVNHAG